MAKIKAKRGLEANIGSVTLEDGEFAITTDTKKLYVGIGGAKICLGGASSLGDMLKSIYDTDNDGIVDAAENANMSNLLGNAVYITNYNTLVPSLVAQGTITPIKAPSNANSPWSNTTSGFLIQSNDTDSFHILTFRSGGDGWAYRSYYQGTWSSWEIWSTFSGDYNDLSNKPTLNSLGAMPKGPLTWNQLKGV